MAAFSDVEHPWSWLYREEVKCTCCSEQINPFGVWYCHPILKTVQCSECNKFYTQGKFTKDSDGYYVHCRWCGEGGTLYGCDDCIESFCKQCILRNLGRSAITEIEGGTKWKCYICNLARITECCEYAKKIQSSVTKYEEHNQEEKLKAEKRKLQKFEKAQEKKAALKATSKNTEPHESTDEDEIEAKIMSLFELLEKGVVSETTSSEKKRKILAKISKNDRKFAELRRKANKIIAEIQNTRSSSEESAASSDDDNERELLGLKKKSSDKNRGRTTKSTKKKIPVKSKTTLSSSDNSDTDEDYASKKKPTRSVKPQPKKKTRIRIKRKKSPSTESDNESEPEKSSARRAPAKKPAKKSKKTKKPESSSDTQEKSETESSSASEED